MLTFLLLNAVFFTILWQLYTRGAFYYKGPKIKLRDVRRLKYILYYNITESKTNNVFWNIKTLKVKYSFSYVLHIIMCPFSFNFFLSKNLWLIHLYLYSRKTPTKMCFGVKTVHLTKSFKRGFTRLSPRFESFKILENVGFYLLFYIF